MSERNGNQKIDRLSLLTEFEAAPDKALFGQITLAAIRDCSVATLERERLIGGGVEYIKCGRSVRYYKSSILQWLDKCDIVHSTSQYQRLSNYCKNKGH